MPDRRLAQVITLADGAELRTIGDAAALIEERFRTTISWHSLETTLVRLQRAAQSGDRQDVQEATDALILVLHHSRMLGPLDEG
jgi:hypothetical protein